MSSAVHLASVELRRFRRSRLTRAAILALLLVPLLYGALYLWAFWDPYSRLGHVQAALVDEDVPAATSTSGTSSTAGTGATVHAGKDLEERLGKGNAGFGWQVVDAATAQKGLDDGRYHVVVTVPRTFSADLVSVAGPAPRAAVLDVRTDDANGYIAGQLSRSVLEQLRAALAQNATKSYVGNVYVSLAQLHDQLGQAADGAQQLGTGLDSARSGAQQLADGTAQLAGGANRLADGAASASAGAQRLSTGAGSLASGLDRLDAATAQLPRQTKALADGAAQVSAGTARLAQAARTASDAAATIDAARATARTDLLAELAAVAAAHPDDPQAQQAVARARTALDRLDGDLTTAGGQVRAVSGQTSALASGAAQVSAGAAKLAAAAPALTTGIGSADAGARQLASGATSLANGLGSLDSGARSLASGAGQAASGASSLSSGLVKLDDGAHTLADGLAKGAAQVPDYTGQDAQDRAAVAANPVTLSSAGINTARTYGIGLAPYFLPLALWVGAMVGYILLRPLAPRALASTAPARRVALAGWLPAAALGVLQSLALLAVLHFALGLDAVHPVALVGFLALTALTFTAILQWVNARFGAAGRLVALVLLMLQLTSAGGTYPIETAPAFFRWLHPLLPMSYVVTGLRHLVSGGPAADVWTATAVLAGFAVVALVATTRTARGARLWTTARLHPELSL